MNPNLKKLGGPVFDRAQGMNTQDYMNAAISASKDSTTFLLLAAGYYASGVSVCCDSHGVHTGNERATGAFNDTSRCRCTCSNHLEASVQVMAHGGRRSWLHPCVLMGYRQVNISVPPARGATATSASASCAGRLDGCGKQRQYPLMIGVTQGSQCGPLDVALSSPWGVTTVVAL